MKGHLFFPKIRTIRYNLYRYNDPKQLMDANAMFFTLSSPFTRLIIHVKNDEDRLTDYSFSLFLWQI